MQWDAAQYLRFGEDRTQVSRDLIARVARRLQPATIVDLGCGPGNSTAVLREQWPDATLHGLDASPEMLATARQSHPELEFRQDDIPEWAASPGPSFDLIFTNSTLQWVPHWSQILPRLLGRVAPGGALALQVPANHDAPAIQLVRAMAAGPWRAALGDASISEWHTEPLEFFYLTLAPHVADIQLWETTYVQVLPDAEDIAEWYKGSGLRPYLQALATDAERGRFLQEYIQRLRAAYPAQADGRVLFPFLRRFVIAWAAS